MIEAATAFHAAALAAIHAAAYPEAGRWSADVMGLQLGLPGAFGFLDAAGGLILARVAADEGEVLTLAVVPAARRRGVGRGLLARAMAEARVRGGASMVLEVAADNLGAQGLYAGAGFVPVGRRRGYYGAGTDAIIMRAALPCG